MVVVRYRVGFGGGRFQFKPGPKCSRPTQWLQTGVSTSELEHISKCTLSHTAKHTITPQPKLNFYLTSLQKTLGKCSPKS